MKNLKQDLKAVNKELKALVRKTERLMKAVDRIEKAQTAAAKKPTPKVKVVKKAAAKNVPAKKKRAKLTATDKVLNIINRSKKGISVQAIMKRTGFDQRKTANILFRVSKMGKIKSVSRGVYVGA
jgi:predicted Rossmann fold nucleotide-binding protein DprA/Smf involved in DNA uptake